eukprot:TRINITY_DN61009_c0_g2_i1.p1 TRINITY_DN61009_c0_g2~~TRINITY_DN61009_c0_g2_i1.p1  ORF type:complete len:510 (+),score=20.69 TRINITY_DN61009_c0_g2_i1:129-1532(+)
MKQAEKLAQKRSRVGVDITSLRRVVAFVGGLDMTNGRWDTPRFNLFKSLHEQHSNDFYNPSSSVATESTGPRQPWHDIHSKVNGPAARDVHRNFVQRWVKQGLENSTNKEDYHKLVPLPLNITTGFVNEEDDKAALEDDPEMWMVQMVRSIDEHAAAAVTGIERSVQDAYLHRIKHARKFIYIENQYFLGSSSSWSSHCSVPCDNEIPQALTDKICDCIAKSKMFVVFLVLPLHPEGSPGAKHIQEILHWQYLTISMMYKQIAAALETHDVTDRIPTDYLSVFCLGNRELTPTDYECSEFDMSVMSRHHAHTRRFMVYVHSKLAVFDDEHVIVGSANINDRSMAGNRDTEIAMVGCQPLYTKYCYGGPLRGAIHAFRMSLFTQHTRRVEQCFKDPNFQCMEILREIGLANWKVFSGEDVIEMESHLMLYPYVVGEDGSVAPVQQHLPDSEADVIGSVSKLLPALLTT